jgi:hypothetical protein
MRMGDGAACEAPVPRQARGQFAPDHACRADDEQFHPNFLPSPLEDHP